MDKSELQKLVSLGETSTVQFKQAFPHKDSIAQEIVAMSNSLGGVILLGVEDVTGNIIGLSAEQIEQYDKDISFIADNIKPTVYITTEVVSVPQNVLVVTVPQGINKPYKTSKGEIFIKQGSNKRPLTDNYEIMRLFQQSANLFADEMEVYDTSIDDISEWRFEQYFTKEFGISYQEKGLTYEQALRAKRVLRNGRVTLAGLLFFGKNIQSIKPAFTVKLVSYFGNDLADNNYRDKPKDLQGAIPELFEQSLTWSRYISKASHTLPYSGLGSGIKRALKEQPDIILENDIQGDQFRVVIPRIVLAN